ncbi:MAG: hypothetical protein NTY50_11340 [Methylobacter sp.]|nr:hypothetical protein [Methylobacter sp.]
MIMINTDKPRKIRVNHNYLRHLRSFALDEALQLSYRLAYRGRGSIFQPQNLSCR